MPDQAAVLEALSDARALLFARGEWDWIGDAVDPLQAWAEANGLVRAIGQDAVQAIMADAFAPPPQPAGAAGCETCGDGPCRLPAFCAVVEEANRWWATIPAGHPLRRGGGK